LKSGHGDSGPAWIGKARASKSGRTIYFNGKAFQSIGGQGILGNYIDIETGEEYWISAVKKNQEDRHWAGSGAVMVDKSIVEEYLDFIGAQSLNPKTYLLVDLDNSDIRQRVHEHENKKMTQ